MTLRIYLTSRVRVENGDLLLDEDALPGRQGRLVLAYLVIERHRPVSRDELSLELWGEDVPDAWEKGLMAIISKLRAALRSVGLPDDTLRTAFGCYQLSLPPDTWVDYESAAAEVHAAETAIEAAARWTATARRTSPTPSAAVLSSPARTDRGPRVAEVRSARSTSVRWSARSCATRPTGSSPRPSRQPRT